MANLFLSHSSHDQAAAEALYEWLRTKGFQALFLDCHPDDGISAGGLWERELYRNLKASDAVIVLCSEASMKSRWCFVEICLARDQGKTIFPIRLDDCMLDRLLDDRQVVDLRSDELRGYERLWSRLRSVGFDPDDSIRWDRDRAPYPGLKVFEEADAGVFFGRDEEVRSLRDLLNQLRARGSPRMVMVAGASGSGKSSLVRAGIVPRIARYSEVWRVVQPFRPGQAPIGSLAQGLATALAKAKVPGYSAHDWLELRDQLQPADNRAVDILVTLAERLAPVERPGESAVLLVVDQWEELLGPDGTKSEFAAFHRLFRGALETPRSPLMAIATIRSDFSDASRNHPAWRGYDWKPFDLGPMSPDRFPELVEGPARAAGLTFVPGLVARLSHDAGVAGALPLLAFTLRQLFEKCKEDGKITLKDYEQHVGGIRGAVSRAVDNAVGVKLTRDDETALRRAFLSHLVWPDDRGRFLRRRAYWNDLSETARPLLEEFIKARLLTSDVQKDTDSHEDRHTVEVVHETLFEAWSRLKGWLDESRELLLWRKGIEGVRHAWEKAAIERKSGFLLTGARVAEANRWLASNSEDLQSNERAFLEASVIAENDRLSRERAATDEKIRLMRERLRLARNRAVFAIAAAVLAVVAIGVAALAIQSDRARKAEEKRHLTTSLAKTRLLQDASLDRERMGESGTSAVLLGHALVEAEAGHDRQLEDALRSSITLARGRLLPLHRIIEVSGEVRGCAISHDGKWAVVGSANGRVWCVDLARSQLSPIPGGSADGSYRTGDDPRYNGIVDITFEPRGSRFAAATSGGTIHLVDVLDASHPSFISHAGQPLSVSFSPDGRSLLVAGRVDKVRHPKPVLLAIYGVDSRTVERTFPVDYDLYVAAFSRDGKRIAVGGGDGSVNPHHPRLTVWDGHDATARPYELSQPARVFSLAFNPMDSSKLVTGDVNGGVHFWDLDSKAHYGLEIPHDMQVRVTSFSEDGRWLLVGGEDGSARVWDVESRTPVSQRLEHRGQVRGGGITIAAGLVVTSDFADGIRLWNIQRSAPAGRILRHPSPVWDATFNQAGDKVLTGCASNTGPASGGVLAGAGRVWDVAGGPPVLLEHGADVMAARFRPNSDGQAVTCGNDGTVFFWDTRKGEKIGAPLSRDNRILYSAAFDKTGSRFAYAGLRGAVRIFDFDSAANAFHEQQSVDKQVYSFYWNLRFGVNQNQLFGDGGPCVRVWNLSRHAARPSVDLPPLPRPEPNGNTKPNDRKVEYWLGGIDGTGRHVLTLGNDGRAAIWDLKDRDQNPDAPPVLLGDKPQGSGRLYADWHGTTNVIAIGGPDGVARLWKSRDGRWTSTKELRHPSSIEVLAFSADGRWLATGCRDGGMRLWSVDSGVWTGAGWYHAGPVTRVQFSPDGRLLLSASRDGTARVVPLPEMTTGEPKAILAELEADAGILVAVEGTGTTSSVTAPQPLSASKFNELRETAKRTASFSLSSRGPRVKK
jgi:WD40 repeat protein